MERGEMSRVVPEPVDLPRLPKLRVRAQERGWPGHFILAHRCFFHRNTLLTLKRGGRSLARAVVSTVGLLQDTSGDVIRMGSARSGPYYETKMFMARRVQRYYWDTDPYNEISLDGVWCIYTHDEKTDYLANVKHERAVVQMSRWMKQAYKEGRLP